MKNFITKYAFRLLWIPFAIACLCGFLALCNVGYPAEWHWWVFPLIAFGPTIALFIVALAETIAMVDVPPPTEDGQYFFHQVECGLMKPTRMFRWSGKATQYRRWYMETLHPMREGKKK